MAALTYQSHLTAATATNVSLQALAQQQEQLHQTQHQIIEQLAALQSIRATQAEALDATDVALLIHWPQLPPTSSEATILAAMADKDVDVGAVGAMDHPY